MRHNISGFVRFADLKSAFASLHRHIALQDTHASDEVWLLHLVKCGFSSEQAAEILQVACNVLRWEAAGGTEHQYFFILEAHRNIWFTTEGLRQCVRFLRGCAAGTPLAGVMFCIGMICILTTIEKRISDNGLESHHNAEGASDFYAEDMSGVTDTKGRIACSHVTYVDDGAFLGFAAAKLIVQGLVDTAIIVHECIHIFLFEANYGVGKTEAILRIAGPGTRAVKNHVRDLGYAITCTSRFGDFTLRIVLQYNILAFRR